MAGRTISGFTWAFAACFCASLGAGACLAAPEPSAWGGPYAGVQVGAASLGGFAVKGPISLYNFSGYSHGGYSFNYASSGPLALTSSSGSKTAATGGLVGGYLAQRGAWVFGIEGQVDPSAITTRSVGSAGPDSRIPLVCQPDPVYNPGNPNLIFGRCLTPSGSSFTSSGPAIADQVTAQTSLQWNASIRARLGWAAGSRWLLSAFAGPSVAQARLSAVQTGVAYYEETPITGIHDFTYFTPLSGSLSGSASRTVWGGAFGVKADYQLADRWRLSAEYAYSTFGAIKLRLTDGASNANTVSASPNLQALRLGLTRRF